MNVKKCARCKQLLPLDKFTSNKNHKDGKQSSCKNCLNNYTKEHYQKNKQKYKDKAAKYRLKVKNKLKNYKSNLFCVVCKESESCCLDFHHINDIKLDNISNLLNTSWEIIKKEIKKCIVLCANCHRKIHAGLIKI